MIGDFGSWLELNLMVMLRMLWQFGRGRFVEDGDKISVFLKQLWRENVFKRDIGRLVHELGEILVDYRASEPRGFALLEGHEAWVCSIFPSHTAYSLKRHSFNFNL